MNPVDSETLAAKSSAANAALERRVAESNRVMAAKQEEMMRKTAAIQNGTTPVPGDRPQAGPDRYPGLRGVDRRDARAREFYDKLYDGKRQRTGGGQAPKPPPPPGLVLKPNKIWGQGRGGKGGGGGGGGRRN